MIRLRRHVVALVVALVSAVPSLADAADAWLPLADVRAGQRAQVRTVFEGARVDTFGAEIVGVLRGGRAGGDIILARATGEPASRTGVAQGMSGSPVYIDGKVIGALSSGWSFAREPIFGITPIQEMLEVLALPPGGTGGPTVGPAGVEAPSPRDRVAESAAWGPFRWDADEAADAGSAPEPAVAPSAAGAASTLRPLAIPLACVGIEPQTLEAVRPRFESLGFTVVQAGRAAGGGPSADALVPGSAVSVDLLRGDLEIAAIGTLTYRDGDRVLAFGHPFFNAGRVSLPLSSAEIATIVPSQLSSFKLGMPGRTVGTLIEDRRTAIAGRIGPVPSLLPLAVEVRGVQPQPQRFHFESVEDRALAPQLMGVAALNAALESGGVGFNQTVRWTLNLRAPGRPALVLGDRVTGDGLMSDLLGQIVSPLAFLFNNPYQTLRLDSVAIAIEFEPGREQSTLRSARLDRPAVKPGGEVVVQIELDHYRGGVERRDVRVPVPVEVGEGDAMIWVGGGQELTRFEAQRLPGRYRVGSLDEAWRRIASVRTSDGIYVALVVPAIEVSSGGLDFPELPVSAHAVLAPPVPRGEAARAGRIALLSEQRVTMVGVVRGEAQLPLRVDENAP